MQVVQAQNVLIVQSVISAVVLIALNVVIVALQQAPVLAQAQHQKNLVHVKARKI
jgi:hypothetical protein